MTMRIAVVAPVWYPVPPPGYGGIELVVSLLVEGLVESGHDVTLFASGGSDTKARLVTPMDEPPDPGEMGNPWYDGFHALSSYLQIGDVDVVHDHAAIVGPVCGALLRDDPPVVHTLHGPWTEQTRRFYSVTAHHVHLVAISDAQRADNSAVPYAGMVHNGIDLALYPYREDKDDFLIYIGRANPDKGPKEAITIARRAGLPLHMILKRNEPPEQEYFEREIRPLLASDIELHQTVSHELKVDLLGRARAMVFPIRWPEPFGLVMVEAMACGTPVVTTNWGAAPEVVDDGVTGYRRDGEDDLVEALSHVADLSPADCRRRVEERFSGPAMVRGYEAVYDEVQAGT
jgi:glycosyltransferase involved in cell wall biosynthesis